MSYKARKSSTKDKRHIDQWSMTESINKPSHFQSVSFVQSYTKTGSPADTSGKNLPANAGDTRDVGLIPGLGRSPRVGNGNSFQYSCLENLMDRGTWRSIGA